MKKKEIQKSTREYKVYIHSTKEWITVTEDVYRAYYRDIWATRNRAQSHGQCMCPKSKTWLCNGDCLACEFRAAGDNLSLDYSIEDDEGNEKSWLEDLRDDGPDVQAIIDYSPCERISAKGGKPQKDKDALTDEQIAKLLSAIKGLPPYVFVMIGLYAGLRREEILGLQWDSVYLDGDAPYISVRRTWHSEHNRPVISTELKTKAARREIPIPKNLAECLREAKSTSTSDFVVANSEGAPLSYTQFKRVWQYIVTRSTKERTYVRYINGQKITKTVTLKLGEKAPHNGNVVYSLDFQVTPHQLRHTYITNLIYASVDPKTVQYLAGHENSKITMDIYAKVKYNKPEQLSAVVNTAFGQPA